jgi:hypothetical protein
LGPLLGGIGGLPFASRTFSASSGVSALMSTAVFASPPEASGFDPPTSVSDGRGLGMTGAEGAGRGADGGLSAGLGTEEGFSEARGADGGGFFSSVGTSRRPEISSTSTSSAEGGAFGGGGGGVGRGGGLLVGTGCEGRAARAGAGT